ncbi:MAG: thiamine diphosphokinase [Coriobacteriaceae bacterium]|nr:thiamine diphosphokinase [Coriobacteriaceae bacterium]
MRVLVVGGSPEVASAATVAQAAAGCDAVVAVDAGLDALAAAGLGADLFCGDADSVSAAGAERVREAERAGGPMGVERYRPHKDHSDLNLALAAVRRCWPGAAIRCTCLSGGRPDHFLDVLGRLASWPGPVELVEDTFTGRILQARQRWVIEGAAGATFSFMPLDRACEVSLSGMRWNLERRRCGLLEDVGLSNVVEGQRAQVDCHAGTIVCWLFENPLKMNKTLQ